MEPKAEHGAYFFTGAGTGGRKLQMGGRPIVPRPMEGRQAERTRCCVGGDRWARLRRVDSLIEDGGQNVLLASSL